MYAQTQQRRQWFKLRVPFCANTLRSNPPPPKKKTSRKVWLPSNAEKSSSNTTTRLRHSVSPKGSLKASQSFAQGFAKGFVNGFAEDSVNKGFANGFANDVAEGCVKGSANASPKLRQSLRQTLLERHRRQRPHEKKNTCYKRGLRPVGAKKQTTWPSPVQKIPSYLSVAGCRRKKSQPRHNRSRGKAQPRNFSDRLGNFSKLKCVLRTKR